MDSDTIYTDENGKPFERPIREPSEDLTSYIRRCHEFDDAVRSCANKAFDDQFRKSLKAVAEITLWKAQTCIHKSGKSLTKKWIAQRKCEPETADKWLQIFKVAEPTAEFQLSVVRPKSRKISNAVSR